MINRFFFLFNYYKLYLGIMDFIVLGEKFFIDVEEFGEKKMFESLCMVMDELLIVINY